MAKVVVAMYVLIGLAGSRQGGCACAQWLVQLSL